MRVLVVDDEPGARSALAAAVRALGHECAEAEDGEDALEKVEAWSPHVVVSDWTMPRLCGVELCARVRDRGTDAGYTYFILLTALQDREHRLAAMRGGADDFLAKPLDVDDLEGRLIAAQRVTDLHARLAHANRALLRENRQSFRAARTDPLTGAANRRQLDEDLEHFRDVAPLGASHSIAMVDLDEFKAFNDRYGHLAGDQELRDVVQVLQSALRSSDRLYRYGGEEFVVLLPEHHGRQAERVMRRVRAKVEERAIRAPSLTGRVGVTISVGIAVLRDDQESVTRWLERADEALYRAKQSGRNRVVVSRPSEPSLPAPADVYAGVSK